MSSISLAFLAIEARLGTALVDASLGFDGKPRPADLSNDRCLRAISESAAGLSVIIEAAKQQSFRDLFGLSLREDFCRRPAHNLS